MLQIGGERLSKLRECRKKAGLTQNELAMLANVHRTIIARVEEGVTNPSYKTLCRLSRALKVPVDAIIDQKGV